MRYRLLGPLEVLRGGVPVELGPPKQRAVLAVLLLNRGRVVSTDRLIDALWGDDAPPSAVGSLQVHVSNLRRALRQDGATAPPIVRRNPGYLLDVTSSDLDLTDFLDAAEGARRAVETGDWGDALRLAEEALLLWRGPMLADLADEDWVRVEATGPEELRTECRERRVAALLALRRTAPAVAEAQQLYAEHPLRARACWLYVLALHRGGRSPEALDELRRHASRLDQELGLEPDVELRDLQTAILRQEPALAAWPRRPHWTGASPLSTPAVPMQDVVPRTTATTEPSGADMVGRTRQKQIFEQLLDDVVGGNSRWLVLSGAAGIGKTRLAQEFVDQLHTRGGTDVWARCPEEEGAPAWWPIRQLVTGIGGHPDSVLVPPDGVDADEARFAIYERFVAALTARVAGLPLALVVDDVQWADATSVRCLAYLAGVLRDQPVAVVLTLRDGERATSDDVRRMLATLARSDGSRQIVVPPLKPAEVQELAGRVAGELFTTDQARLLAERTGGNPLFVCEYARLPAAEREADTIPVAVRSLLGRRLAGLDPEVLAVLRAAAVIGDVLEVDVLAAVTGLDFDTLADLLDEAADEHILVVAPDTGGYAFAHGLLREEVLAGMSALRRQRMHARVGDVLADAVDGERLSRRAQHLAAALPLVDAVQVLAACRAAALDNEHRWSWESAAQWWQESLRAFDLLPASARPADAARDRDDLLVAQVEALARAGQGQTIMNVVEAGLLDALRHGRTSAAGRLAAALLRCAGAWPWAIYGEAPGPLLTRLVGVEPSLAGDPAAHARVLAALAVGRCYDPDPAVPDGLSSRALQIAYELADPDVVADAILGRVYTYIGVAAHAQEAVQLLDRLNRLPHRQSQLDDVLSHAMLTMTMMNLGDTAAAAEHVRQAIAGSELLRLPVIRVQMRWMRGEMAQWRGDFVEAEAEFETAATIHQQTELYAAGTTDISFHTLLWQRGRVSEVGPTVVEPRVWAAAAAAARGETDEAAELAAAWLARPGPAVWTTLGHQVLLAHTVADLRLSGLAPPLIGALSPFTGRIATIGQVGNVGSVDSARARLHALLGDTATALELLDRARELAQRTGGIPTLLSCRLQAARLAADSPDRRAELSAVAEEAARIGMAHVARLARDELKAGATPSGN